MITAKVKKDSSKYISFECKGHADFARHGEDIVCSAVSVLTINTANSILELSKTKIDPIENDGYLSWSFDDIDDNATLLMDSLVLGLKTIEDTYNKKYLTLIIEEVQK